MTCVLSCGISYTIGIAVGMFVMALCIARNKKPSSDTTLLWEIHKILCEGGDTYIDGAIDRIAEVMIKAGYSIVGISEEYATEIRDEA
jgi:hypothetical protein